MSLGKVIIGGLSKNKYYCDCDLDKFREKVKARDQGMVDHINKECASYGEIAVTSGASFNRG